MNTKYLLIAILLYFLCACASIKTEIDIAGIYKVVSKECSGNTQEKLSCNDIQLIEIVKGNFYKVKDSEFAFVIWSGDLDLDYNARKISNISNNVVIPFELVVDKNRNYVEKVTFNSGDTLKYEFGASSSVSTINCIKANSEDLTRFKKEYPGNN